MRFCVLRVIVPRAAFAALTEKAESWWDDFIDVIGAMFDPYKRKAWQDKQRAESLDADQIDHGSHGGYAAGCGSDEG